MKIPFFSRPAPAVPESKASRGMTMQMTGLAPPVWMARKFENFVKEAYAVNVVAYQAVNKLATAVANVEWEVWDGEKQLAQHPLLDLLRAPNPLQSGSDWWRARTTFLLLSGSSFDERVFGSGSQIKELWPLRPDWMKVIPGRSSIPAAYDFKYGQNTTRFPVDEITGDSDILHMSLFNPLNPLAGLSPVEAAAYAVDQHNAAMMWLQSLLQNSARPSGALIYPGDTQLSDEEFVRLKAEMEQQYSGARNAGRPMLLEGGLDWKQMGLSPADMEILRIKDSAARDISLAFGVPPLLLNIPGDNTYANYREARLGFYEDTVLPLIAFMAAELSAWLGPYFGNVELRANKDKIEAIADKRRKLWEMADASEDLTINESRKLKGYDPLPAPLGEMLVGEMRKKPATPEENVAAAALKGVLYGSR